MSLLQITPLNQNSKQFFKKKNDNMKLVIKKY